VVSQDVPFDDNNFFTSRSNQMKNALTLTILLLQFAAFAQCDTLATFDFENTCKLEYPFNEDDIIQKIEIDDARFFSSAYLRFGEDSIYLNGTWDIISQDSTSMELMRADYMTNRLIQYPRLKFFGGDLEYFGNNNTATYLCRTFVEFLAMDTVITLKFGVGKSNFSVLSYTPVFFDGSRLLLKRVDNAPVIQKESVILQISKNAMTGNGD
jgi:hypothetical protein